MSDIDQTCSELVGYEGSADLLTEIEERFEHGGDGAAEGVLEVALINAHAAGRDEMAGEVRGLIKGSESDILNDGTNSGVESVKIMEAGAIAALRALLAKLPEAPDAAGQTIKFSITSRERWSQLFGGYPADAPDIDDAPPSKVVAWKVDFGDVYKGDDDE